MKAEATATVTIDQLIAVANQLLLSKADKPLDWHEEAILKHILAGEPLKTAQAGHLRRGTIERQIAPKLWQRLGKEVRSKNVRLFLEEIYQANLLAQQAEDNQEAERSFAESRWSSSVQTAFQESHHTHAGNTSSSGSHNTPKRVFHNLPKQPCSKFIGRREEVDRLLKLLSPKHAASLICIAGLGGVGKTSLATTCAWRCLHRSCAPDATPAEATFDLIIFTTAKHQFLTYNGLHNRLDLHQKDLIRQIIEMLDSNHLLDQGDLALTLAEQTTLIYKVLANYRTLLILDNLEVIENRQTIDDFLCDLPSSVKSVITTREGIMGNCIIRLTAMSEPEGLKLVEYQAGEMGVRLSVEESKALYQLTGGLPIAIDLAIGQLSQGYSMQVIRHRLLQPVGNLAQFCFASSVQTLRNRSSYWLLLATALFPEPALRQALIAIAIPEVDLETAEESIVELQRLSLISQEYNAEKHSSRYKIIAPTRAYIISELNNQFEFRRVVYERWINWYVDFSFNYHHQDPSVWQGEFGELDAEWENLHAVANWCMAEACYEPMLKIWQNLKSCFYSVGRKTNRVQYWKTGLAWTEWLIQTALQRADWQTAGELLSFRAWRLTTIGDEKSLQDASELLSRSWELREYQPDLKDQSNLARQIGYVNIRQNEFVKAREWLEQSETILQQANVDDYKRQECLSHIRYYQGVAYFNAGDVAAAQPYFEAAWEYARAIGQDRVLRVIENSLAEVAMHQKDFKRAKQLLDQGLLVAKANQDHLRMAFIQESLAKLADAQNNLKARQQHASEAIQIFVQLGMTAEAEKVKELLNLASTKSSDRV
ncbi:MAG: NB-ARC domain-containing protein [Elainella sp. Prado103]|nr:NB-ARC domain-containing protein [Elainella sp. Prado103]